VGWIIITFSIFISPSNSLIRCEHTSSIVVRSSLKCLGRKNGISAPYVLLISAISSESVETYTWSNSFDFSAAVIE